MVPKTGTKIESRGPGFPGPRDSELVPEFGTILVPKIGTKIEPRGLVFPGPWARFSWPSRPKLVPEFGTEMVPKVIPAGWFSWSAWNGFPGFRGARFPLLVGSFLIRCGAVFAIPFLACAGSFPDHVLTHFLVIGSFSGTCILCCLSL